MMSTTYPFVQQKGFAEIAHLRDYTGNALVYCSASLFEGLFMPMETYIRHLESTTEITKGTKVGENIITHVMSATPNKILHNCHQAKKKLVTNFVRFRLRLSANFSMSKDVVMKKKRSRRTG